MNVSFKIAIDEYYEKYNMNYLLISKVFLRDLEDVKTYSVEYIYIYRKQLMYVCIFHN